MRKNWSFCETKGSLQKGKPLYLSVAIISPSPKVSISLLSPYVHIKDYKLVFNFPF